MVFSNISPVAIGLIAIPVVSYGLAMWDFCTSRNGAAGLWLKRIRLQEFNKAIANNPAYIQLQVLEALKEISKDPAAKLYFMDANSAQPLPLTNLGEPMRR